MSGSDDDFHFASADEDDPTVTKTKVKKNETPTKAAVKIETKVDTAESKGDVKDAAAQLADTLESVDISDKDKEDKSPAEIRESLANEERKREVTPTRKVERHKRPDEGGAEKTEKEKQVLQNLEDAADSQPASGGWGWGSIGNIGTMGSSLLNTASSSVSTFTSSVGEGFDKFVETVEYSLGAEDPEEFAKKEYEMQQQMAAAAKAKAKQRGSSESEEGVVTAQVTTGPIPETIPRDGPAESGIEGQSAEGSAEEGSGWMAGWGLSGLSDVVKGTTNVVKKTVKDTSTVVQQTTGAVGKTGKNLVFGGLDMLETLGKKTYDVLAEGDHGIKKTIQQTKDKPNLSQLLREAKDDAEDKAKQEEEFVEARKAHFGAQFDDFQGLVQLEALEMLSNQCEGKVQNLLTSMSPESLAAVKAELVAIKGEFELKDLEDEDDEDRDHEFDRLMNEHIGQVGLNATAEKIIHVQEKNRKWIMDCMQEQEDGIKKPAKEIHESAIQSLAELTARSIELFHKVGQLLLTEKEAPLNSYKTKAAGLANGTRVLCGEVGILSTKYTQTLTSAAEEPDSVNPLITNVYLEATNSSTYIQDAFQLLLPVLQQAAMNANSNV